MIFERDDLFISNFISSGFNFSFIRFLKFGSRLFFNVDKKKIGFYKLYFKTLLKSSWNKGTFFLLMKINHEIKNCSEKIIFFSSKKRLLLMLDIYIYKLLWKYLRRLHSKKTSSWVYSKYWRCFSGTWRFFVIDYYNGDILVLKSHFDLNNFFEVIDIFRISSSLNFLNLYNKNRAINFLFEKFKYKFLPNLICLYNSQRGLCFICKKPIYSKNFKILNLSKSNAKLFEKLFLIHLYCHDL